MTETTEILRAVKNANTVLVCGHVRPDGDCVGAATAMRHICEKLGKTADAVCDGEKPTDFAFLPEYDDFCAPRFKNYDLFIAVDCATEKRLGAYAAQLASAKNSIGIDHHPTNGKYCAHNYIDGTACSTCYILYELFKDSGLLDKECATMLYTGLSTDTGHFMHSNTTADAFRVAAALCDYGVDIGGVNHSIYCSKSMSRIKLTARALDGIRLFENGRIALMIIDQSDLAACGCTLQDTEGLIDNASSIKGVEISIAMCEQPGGFYRVSFRSVNADVASAAERFGGGGHKLAAGCIISGNRYDVADKVVSAATSVLVSK